MPSTGRQTGRNSKHNNTLTSNVIRGRLRGEGEGVVEQSATAPHVGEPYATTYAPPPTTPTQEEEGKSD